MQGFHLKLRNHLLPRLKAILNKEQQEVGKDIPPPHSLTEEMQREMHEKELNSIYFKNDRLYKHNIMRINYTSYDIRRAQDTINPNTDHCDIMLLAQCPNANTETHQYMYARVIGIYHANVIFAPPGTQSYRARHMEFLWVRWLQVVGDHPVQRGWNHVCLDRLKFPHIQDEGAFGFIDPDDVLRGCHLIPRFSMGQRDKQDIEGSELARVSDDWHEYYANRWVPFYIDPLQS